MAPITSQTLEFDGTATQMLLVSAAADSEAIAQALVLPDFGAVILLFGGADQLDAALAAPVAAMLGNALLPAALKAEAVIIDGGTRSGVMELMGQVRMERDQALPLIGVAPEALVDYPGKTGDGLAELDPGHSHFVLVRGTQEWGSETSTLFKVFNGLKNKPAPAPKASLVLLVGGGAVTQTEVLEAVRQRQPVIVFSGSGGFADVLTAAKAAATPTTDPLVQTILAQGELYFCPLRDPLETIQLTIGHFLEKDQVLQNAWEAFADFDCNAGLQQKIHKRYQSWIIRLGILAAALGIAYQVFIKDDKDQCLYWLDKPMHGLLVILPIVLTILIAASNKFKNGLKWIFFRAGAEAIKREIYTYRTRTGAYRGDTGTLLMDRIGAIVTKAMGTDINHTYIRPYDKKQKFPPYMEGDQGTDDGFSRLSPAAYIRFRLSSQVRFYEGKVRDMNEALRWYNLAVYIITGCGTLLAFFGLQVWIALTTSVVAAIGTWLGYMQWENTLSKYNQGAAELKRITGWWNALMPAEQTKAENIEHLVATAELALQNEYDGWTQQMQQSLAEQSKRQQEEQAAANKAKKP